MLFVNLKLNLIMSKNKTSILLFTLLFTILFFQINLSFFGEPYHFHPDELSILKRPLKLLSLYSNGDFTNSMSLFMWVQTVWYGFCFFIGQILNYWTDLESFKDSIILESWNILFLFRTLSIIITFAGHLILLKLLRKFTANNYYFILISSIVLLNPITISSTFWVKYEAISYLTFCLILYYSFQHFIFKGNVRNKLYLILFIALTVRIELSVFVLSILYFDYKNYHTNIYDYLNKNYKISI